MPGPLPVAPLLHVISHMLTQHTLAKSFERREVSECATFVRLGGLE